MKHKRFDRGRLFDTNKVNLGWKILSTAQTLTLVLKFHETDLKVLHLISSHQKNSTHFFKVSCSELSSARSFGAYSRMMSERFAFLLH